ncbi:MAG: tellurite resistance TerB family protein [Deltaproteobacteria bacterium]|nr:tellurite resistance TerB family protein [Deltaproteobacteria bacterium]
MPLDQEDLLARVARGIGQSAAVGAERTDRSITRQAAASFAVRPSGACSTMPTGFDPQAAMLFEAVIEAAFLVASADGEFDETEQAAFVRVVQEACPDSSLSTELGALVSDLSEQLAEDGLSQRVLCVAAPSFTEEQRREVLRVAALMAYVSGGVGEAERKVLEGLADGFRLGGPAVEDAIGLARDAMMAR